MKDNLTYDEQIKKMKEVISEGNIVFFGGAGVSTASGMKDFRSEDGLYNEKNEFRWPPETILSHSFFYKKPKVFYEFYRKKMNSLPYEPNIIHKTLAEWENQGLLNSIITQNIDNLHQKAGSKNVIELHGTSMKNRCANKNCLKEYNDLDNIFYGENDFPVCPDCGTIIKPEIVLYEEQILNMDKAITELQKAKTLIIAGCSLQVYPAASLIQYFYGDNLFIINKGIVPNEEWADIVIHDDMKKVFEDLSK